MSPRKNGQKLKRSTSKPRAGSKRTARRLPTPAPRPEIELDVPTVPDNPAAVTGAEPNRDRAHRWSVTYPTRQRLFDDNPTERRPPYLEEFHPAALEQFEEARQVAMRILDSGVVGDRECVVLISGQGNTDHTPTNGQPNDALTVMVRQVATGWTEGPADL